MWAGLSLDHCCCPSFFAPSGEDAEPETPQLPLSTSIGCSCISKSGAESRWGLYWPFSWGPTWDEPPGLRDAALDRVGFVFSSGEAPGGAVGLPPLQCLHLFCHHSGFILHDPIWDGADPLLFLLACLGEGWSERLSYQHALQLSFLLIPEPLTRTPWQGWRILWPLMRFHHSWAPLDSCT